MAQVDFRALDWYRKDADQGHSASLVELGDLYEHARVFLKTTRKPRAGT